MCAHKLKNGAGDEGNIHAFVLNLGRRHSLSIYKSEQRESNVNLNIYIWPVLSA